MAITLDRDLARDTSVSLLYSTLGVLQYGRVNRAYFVQGVPITLDGNGTDGTITTKAVDAVKAEIPVGAAHPNAAYSSLKARDYQYVSTGAPGVHEVIVCYIFDTPLNPDYTLDLDSWLEAVESYTSLDGSGNPIPVVVDNYTVNWKKDTDAYPGTPKVLPPAYGTTTIMIPRAKWVVTKTASALTAGTVQGVKGTYLAHTNDATIFGEAVGTVLCSRIATATEPWLGRASITAEFLVKPEGWKQYEAYSSPLTNGIPGNVWRAHGAVAANGVVTLTVQSPATLATLLSLF